MDRNIENDFEVLFENNSTTNYLVLKARKDMKILDYQVQMLLNNKIKGLLEFNANYVGGELNCFYNVTSKCSLVSFMSRKKFTRDEFLVMLLNMINNICHIKNYLLYDYNILLDERYIYVEPDKMELFFVYLPYNSIKNDYKAFLLKLVVEMARFSTENSDNYLQKILEYIKNDLFSLGTFKTQLENLLGSEIKNFETGQNYYFDSQKVLFGNINSESTVGKNKRSISDETSDNETDRLFSRFIGRLIDKSSVKFTDHRMMPESTEKKHEKTVKELKRVVGETIQSSDNKSRNIKIPVVPVTEDQTENTILPKEKADSRQKYISNQRNDKITSDSSKVKKLPVLGIILLQPILVILYILTVTSSFINTSDNKLETAIIALVIFVCIDVLVFRLIRDRLTENKDDNAEQSKSMDITGNIDKLIKYDKFDKANKLDKDTEVVSYITAQMRAGSQEQQAIIAEEESFINQNPVSQSVYHGETEIIKKPKIKSRTYLKELEGETIIELDKKSILVGRMEGFVDTVIRSSAVGKIHAELLCEEGDFYIIDCNSRNGTFINDKRIVPNSKIKIQNNDTIRFANKEFKFINSALSKDALA